VPGGHAPTRVGGGAITISRGLVPGRQLRVEPALPTTLIVRPSPAPPPPRCSRLVRRQQDETACQPPIRPDAVGADRSGGVSLELFTFVPVDQQPYTAPRVTS
jgi:hypothetical protein